MSAPKMQPNGFVNVTSTARMQGRLAIYGYGVDARAINPGDLVIVTTDEVRQNMHKQVIEFVLQLKGKDMALFEEHAHNANLLYQDNKHWLNASISTPNLDMRSLSQIRLADQLAAVESFRR